MTNPDAPVPVRRVVTGKDANGKAVILSDALSPNVRSRKDSGVAVTGLWLTNSTPAAADRTDDPAAGYAAIPPPNNGTIFRIVEIASEANIKTSFEDRVGHTRQMGLTAEGDQKDHPRHPGMHRTRTLDYAIILSGEIDMLLDDSEVHLKAGDIIIQQATNHAWMNRGHQTCRIAFILIDAKD
jgi:naringenin degradation protein FdeH